MTGALISLALLILLPTLGFSAGALESEAYQRLDGEACLPTPVQTSTIYTYSKVRSAVECGQRCSGHHGCSGVAFSERRGVCHLHNATLQSSDCAGTGDDWQVWQRLYLNTPACQNGGIKTAGGGCQCFHGFVGDYCHHRAEDCMEAMNSGYYPELVSRSASLATKPALSPDIITVFCRDYGLTVVLRQFAARYTQGLNFTWDSYLRNISLPHNGGAHWMGLRALYYYTNSKSYNLRLHVRVASGQLYQLGYRNFRLTDNTTFTASLGPYISGPSDMDLLGDIHGNAFSTLDHDGNSSSNHTVRTACARQQGGGWWYGGSAGGVCGTDYNLVGKMRAGQNVSGPQYVHYGQTAPSENITQFVLSLEPQ